VYLRKPCRTYQLEYVLASHRNTSEKIIIIMGVNSCAILLTSCQWCGPQDKSTTVFGFAKQDTVYLFENAHWVNGPMTWRLSIRRRRKRRLDQSELVSSYLLASRPDRPDQFHVVFHTRPSRLECSRAYPFLPHTIAAAQANLPNSIPPSQHFVLPSPRRRLMD
jgi:hypothetical protein